MTCRDQIFFNVTKKHSQQRHHLLQAAKSQRTYPLLHIRMVLIDEFIPFLRPPITFAVRAIVFKSNIMVCREVIAAALNSF